MGALKAEIAAGHKQISQLMTAEVKRVATDYHAAAVKPEQDLAFIIESLVGERMSEFKKLLMPAHV